MLALRQVLPVHGLIATALGTLLFAAFVFECLAIYTGSYGLFGTAAELSGELNGFRVVESFILVVAAVLYGVYRVTDFHPHFRSDYGSWLAASPWSPDKPLPAGPLHLVIADAAIVGAIGVGAAWSHPTAAIAVAEGFVITFILCHVIVWWSLEMRATNFAALFVLSLVLWPVGALWLTILILIIASAAMNYLIASTLRQFPWDNEGAEQDAYDPMPVRGPMRKDLAPAGPSKWAKSVGWPMCVLGPKAAPPRPNQWYWIGLFATLTWYALLLIPYIDRSDSKVFGDSGVLALILFAMFVSLISIRGIAYRFGSAAPISFWGRLLTSRWIIPRYDVVYLATWLWAIPLIGMYVAIEFDTDRSIQPKYVVAVLFAVSGAIHSLVPPSRHSWYLTGGWRSVARGSELGRLIRKI